MTFARTLAVGLALSFGFAIVATVAFLLSRFVLHPDSWRDPGLGWLAVLAASGALTWAAGWGCWRAFQRAEHEGYLRANSRR